MIYYLNFGRSVPAPLKHLIFVLALFLIVDPLYVVNTVPNFLLYKLIAIIFFLFPVYLNLYVLIPLLLQKSRKWYGLSLLMLIILFAFINYLRFEKTDPAYVPGYVKFNHPFISILFLFISLFILIVATMFFNVMRLYQEQQEQLYKLEQSRLESELEVLKLQISPHFFFNIMNSIYHSVKIDPDQAERIVLHLSQMMQYYIYDCSKDRVPLEGEVKNVLNYIALQKMRLATEPKISVHVTGNTVNKFIPPFIIITLVENAFRHGLEKQLHQPFLNIDLLIEEETLLFTVQNSKPSMVQGQISNNGAGLALVRKRLDLLYPSTYRLEIKNEDDKFLIQLKIALFHNPFLVS